MSRHANAVAWTGIAGAAGGAATWAVSMSTLNKIITSFPWAIR